MKIFAVIFCLAALLGSPVSVRGEVPVPPFTPEECRGFPAQAHSSWEDAKNAKFNFIVYQAQKNKVKTEEWRKIEEMWTKASLVYAQFYTAFCKP